MVKLIEYVRLLIQNIIGLVTSQLNPSILNSKSGLQPIFDFDKLLDWRTNLCNDYEIRRFLLLPFVFCSRSAYKRPRSPFSLFFRLVFLSLHLFCSCFCLCFDFSFSFSFSLLLVLALFKFFDSFLSLYLLLIPPWAKPILGAIILVATMKLFALMCCLILKYLFFSIKM
jgi:hypothetical protein